jgi:hypothetical protein
MNDRGELELKKIQEDLSKMPKDVGWLLLITGLASEAGLPGVPPFWIAGLLILWPKTGVLVSRPIQRHFPRSFHHMHGMISRYINDLHVRFPLV